MADPTAIARSDWPEFGLADDMRPLLAQRAAEGRPAVLATLFAAEGGAPRGIGAQMLIWQDGIAGYLSGGCVEADIALHARECLDSGEPKVLVYGRGGPADIALPCGGRIEVLLERLAPGDEAISRLIEFAGRRVPALYLSDGRQRACVAQGEAVPQFEASVQRVYEPHRRIALFASDPVVLALASLMAPAGYEILVARPKGPAAAPPVSGGYVTTNPADTISALDPDPWTAIVVAMHDEIDDHEALVAALRSRAGYVGLLGSRRRLQEKIARLRTAGLDEEAIGRLRAPIGLPGLGRGPWQIAASIQAEVMQQMWRHRIEVAEFQPAPLAAE